MATAKKDDQYVIVNSSNKPYTITLPTTQTIGGTYPYHGTGINGSPWTVQPYTQPYTITYPPITIPAKTQRERDLEIENAQLKARIRELENKDKHTEIHVNDLNIDLSEIMKAIGKKIENDKDKDFITPDQLEDEYDID